MFQRLMQMESEIQKAKEALRSQIREVLKKIAPEKRKVDSQNLSAELKVQPFIQSSTSILFFAPLPDELDLWPALEEVLAEGKIVALPCFDAENQRYLPRRVTDLRVELVSGRFGIREPEPACMEVPLADLDAILVPGVAFDVRGYRLGRGKGFYDRLLADFTGRKIGIAFDEQLVGAVPTGKDDVRMNFILTPSRCVNCDG